MQGLSFPEQGKKQGEPGDLYVGTGENPGTMLDQLADMTAQQNELVRRCEEAGIGDEARLITGGISSEPEEKQKFDKEDLQAIAIAAENAAKQVKKAIEMAEKAMTQSKEKMKEMLSEAKKIAKAASQSAEDVEELAREAQRKAEEVDKITKSPKDPEANIKYDWKRPPIRIGFGKPEDVYEKLDEKWEHISPGSKRDANKNPLSFPQYLPWAVAYKNTLGSGIVVPIFALASSDSFRLWAESEGMGEGLALEVTDMMAKPGHQSLIKV